LVGSGVWSKDAINIPGLCRPPKTDDGCYEIQALGVAVIQGDWNWEEAEEQLKKAYREGYIATWAQTTLRQLEAEITVERTKRDREQEAASASG
jgi:hypothetical protein